MWADHSRQNLAAKVQAHPTTATSAGAGLLNPGEHFATRTVGSVVRLGWLAHILGWRPTFSR
jgi:hypothetical protein